MSKALEALNYVWYNYYTEELGEDIREEIEKNLDVIEQALQRLEEIDNAEPSEALEALQRIKEENCEEDNSIGTIYYEECNTIKQALLKAEKEHNSINLLMQELDCKDFAELRKYARCGYEKMNKQYLKWEDLEFSEETKGMKVRMNGTEYILRYTLDVFGGKCCFLYDSARNYHIDLTRQFFNDLHLERVEE